MACTFILYVTLLLILFVENLFNSVLKHILKVLVLLFLSHPSTRYWLHIYSHCYWNITILKYNMITLRYREWDQNTFTPVAVVNYDSLKNNENTLVNNYMWNCGSCMFIAIQNTTHLNRAKVWNEIFSAFSSFWISLCIFLKFSSFFWMIITSFLMNSNSHMNATEMELHLKIGSNICLHNIGKLGC